MPEIPKAQLQPRDLELFKYLFDHKIALVEQIKRDIYASADISQLYKRLKRFNSEEYIRKISVHHNWQTKSAYHLTKKGLEMYQLVHGLDLDQTILKSDAIAHDLILVDLLFTLKKYQAIEDIITANQLACESWLKYDEGTRPCVDRHSDAYFKLTLGSNSFNCAFGYEQSRKTTTQIGNELLSYAMSEKKILAIYCTPCRDSQNYIKSRVRRLKPEEQSLFLFCLKDDVLAAREYMYLRTTKDLFVKIS